MPAIDLHAPQFTQKQVTEATTADNKTVDNYVQFGHATPHRVEGRRLFTALQTIEIEVTARLATLFSIPPKVGSVIARRAVSEKRLLLEADASSIGDATWPLRTSHGSYEDSHANITRGADGSVQLLDDAVPDGIMLVVPVRAFARAVMFKLASEAD